jgi:hypothetical protein
MTAGDFGAALNSGGTDELGQIEDALVQLVAIQKSLAKDIVGLGAKHSRGDAAATVEEKPYTGEYRKVVQGINGMTTAHVKAVASAVENANGLRSDLAAVGREVKEFTTSIRDGRLSHRADTRQGGNKGELAMGLNDLMTAVARAVEESAQKATRAATEAAMFSKQAAQQSPTFTAPKPVERTIIKPVLPKPAPFVAPKPIVQPKPKPTPLFTPKFGDAAKPATTRMSAGRNITPDPPVITTSGKNTPPSGAHEYDRKDLGKY